MSTPRSYIVLLITATGLLWLLSTGFILWPGPENTTMLNQLSREAFSGICHQFSWRSFGQGEHHMAVCSRCFGIYSGFFAVSLAGLLLLLISARPHRNLALLLLAGSIALNGFDVLGNALGWWTNTLFSRFFMGISIGAGLILLILSMLPQQNE